MTFAQKKKKVATAMKDATGILDHEKSKVNAAIAVMESHHLNCTQCSDGQIWSGCHDGRALQNMLDDNIQRFARFMLRMTGGDPFPPAILNLLTNLLDGLNQDSRAGVVLSPETQAAERAALNFLAENVGGKYAKS